MKLLFKNNLVPFILTGIFIIAGGLAILLTEKHELHYILNQSCVYPSLDPFFVYFTYFGDGVFISITLLIMLFINFRLFLTSAASFAVSAAITHLLKLVVFAHEQRPSTYFNNFKDLQLKTVQGLDLLGENSFPSGHTSAAFSLFFVLALAASRGWLKGIYFFIALIVGFSRVYLSQHFVEDIYGGALIGITCSFLFFYIFYFAPNSGRFNKLDAPVTKLLFSPKTNA